MVDNKNSAFDELHLSQDKSIKKQLENGEEILLTAPVYKFNDYKKRQERHVMVTTRALYNLDGSDIKRRIDLKNIKAVTVGTLGSEFVLHVPEEYDYRYASSERRERILHLMTQALTTLTGQKLPYFFKEEVCLFNYATTKQDKKKGLSRMPTEGGKLLDGHELKQIIDGKTREQEDIKSRTHTLWSREQGREVNVDNFSILKVLGAGAFGTVLLVEDKQTKEWYAMKVIKKEVIIKKGQFEHTKTEKMILEHVNHPFLVSLVYSFQDPTRLFFVMQFMKGGELFQHLRVSRKFEEKRAKFYTAQLALGLGHLHSKDIVYRDLKLENILMDHLGNVYLTDFGMAKTLQEDQLGMTFCGTPEYLSPEVIKGLGCDRTTDWWSLGILTYEMMYGLPPFYNKNQNVMFKLIKEGELRFPDRPQVSKEGQDFITKCLNRDKSQRIGHLGDVKEIIEHPWFKDIDIAKLEKKQIPPPFTPKVADESWIDNFDKDFTSMKPKIAEEGEQQKTFDQNAFEGF